MAFCDAIDRAFHVERLIFKALDLNIKKLIGLDFEHLRVIFVTEQTSMLRLFYVFLSCEILR